MATDGELMKYDALILKLTEVRGTYGALLHLFGYAELAKEVALSVWNDSSVLYQLACDGTVGINPARLIKMLDDVDCQLTTQVEVARQCCGVVNLAVARRLLGGEVGAQPPLKKFLEAVVAGVVEAHADDRHSYKWFKSVRNEYMNYLGVPEDPTRLAALGEFVLQEVRRGNNEADVLVKAMTRRTSCQRTRFRRNIINYLAKEGKVILTHDRHQVVRPMSIDKDAPLIHNPQGLDRRDVLFFYDTWAVGPKGDIILFDDVGGRELLGFCDDPSRATPILGKPYTGPPLTVRARATSSEDCCRLNCVPYSYVRWILYFLLQKRGITELLEREPVELDRVMKLRLAKLNVRFLKEQINAVADKFNANVQQLLGKPRPLDPYYIVFGSYAIDGRLLGRTSFACLVRSRLVSEIANGDFRLVFDEDHWRERDGSQVYIEFSCGVPSSYEELLANDNVSLIVCHRGRRVQPSSRYSAIREMARRRRIDFQDLSLIVDLVGRIMRERELASYEIFFHKEHVKRRAEHETVTDPLQWISYHTGAISNYMFRTPTTASGVSRLAIAVESIDSHSMNQGNVGNMDGASTHVPEQQNQSPCSCCLTRQAGLQARGERGSSTEGTPESSQVDGRSGLQSNQKNKKRRLSNATRGRDQSKEQPWSSTDTSPDEGNE